MADQFVGEIRIFAFLFAPRNWAFANGQILAIQQNQALFALLGTTFGGNGVQTFALPNLQGRAAMGFSPNHPWGQSIGEATHQLTTQEIPSHTHTPSATNAAGTLVSPAGAFWANDSNQNAMYGTAPTLNLSPSAIGAAGGSQAHNNMMPSTSLNFCIALNGIFPSRS